MVEEKSFLVIEVSEDTIKVWETLKKLASDCTGIELTGEEFLMSLLTISFQKAKIRL